MKSIKELTESEAIELLSFVYPKYGKDDFWSIRYERELKEDGGEYITFGGRSIIGIEYHNGQDRCILHFENTKAVLWLYKNGYDITEMLEANAYMTQMENYFSSAMAEISYMSKGEEGFREGFEQNWTLEYVKKKCKDIFERYYLADWD